MWGWGVGGFYNIMSAGRGRGAGGARAEVKGLLLGRRQKKEKKNKIKQNYIKYFG